MIPGRISIPVIVDEKAISLNEANTSSSNIRDRFRLLTFAVLIGLTRNLNGAVLCLPMAHLQFSQLVGWVKPFAKPIAFIDENRWVSLHSTHPTRCTCRGARSKACNRHPHMGTRRVSLRLSSGAHSPGPLAPSYFTGLAPVREFARPGRASSAVMRRDLVRSV